MPDNKIKIMKFLTHFGVGGTERQFVYLTQGLDRSRFDLRVGCLARIGSFMKDIEALNVPISEYKTKSLYSYQTLRQQVQLARDVRRNGIDIVHSYGFYPNVFAVPAVALSTNCVTIASVRDMGAFTDRKKMRAITQAVACRLADCILANSNAVRTWLIAQGLQGYDIRVIPNGIAMPPQRDPRAPSPIRDELKIDRRAPLIAVIGRLVRIKGVETFLEAAAAVTNQFPEVRFLVVGESQAEPAYRSELQSRAASLNLAGRVAFTGQRTDVPNILREIDISVQPSLTESFSNSLLESMAHGLPVIATNVGGNPEMVDDGVNGILIPPRDAAALGRAMTELLESPHLATRLGKAAREKVSKEFSLETMLHRTEDLYCTLLGRRREMAVQGMA